VNIGANVVSPSNDFSHLAPRFISFRTGGLITGCIGLLMMPWKLMASHTDYITWLVSYSGLLGPVAGIMIADYFFIRDTRLDTEALYRRDGPYEYIKGINPRAMIALAAGVFVALIGRIVPDLHFLYEYAWFVGFGVAAVLYIALMDSAGSVGGATPLAQRIAVKDLVDPALGNSAGAKARSTTV
jgi:NCS1 family nucleobase:cation symporter-1